MLGTTGATLAIALGATTTGGSHKIKVSMIECTSLNKAPAGCLQYFTGISGTVSTYNHQGGRNLHNQFYSTCVRQEFGYCTVDFREAPTAIQAFNTGSFFGGPGFPPTVQTVCDFFDNGFLVIPNDVIEITNLGGGFPPVFSVIKSGVRCGSAFGNIFFDDTPGTVRYTGATPFILTYFTALNSDATSDIDDVPGTGYALDYSQVPC